MRVSRTWAGRAGLPLHLVTPAVDQLLLPESGAHATRECHTSVPCQRWGCGSLSRCRLWWARLGLEVFPPEEGPSLHAPHRPHMPRRVGWAICT